MKCCELPDAPAPLRRLPPNQQRLRQALTRSSSAGSAFEGHFQAIRRVGVVRPPRSALRCKRGSLRVSLAPDAIPGALAVFARTGSDVSKTAKVHLHGQVASHPGLLRELTGEDCWRR